MGTPIMPLHLVFGDTPGLCCALFCSVLFCSVQDCASPHCSVKYFAFMELIVAKFFGFCNTGNAGGFESK